MADEKPTWANPTQPPPEFTRTGMFKSELGRAWPIWLWLSKQFSPTSLGLIGALLAGAWLYVVHLDSRITSIDTKLQLLEGKMPSGESAARLADDLSHVRESVGVISQRIDSQDKALQRIYERFDLDYIDTMTPLSKRKRK